MSVIIIIIVVVVTWIFNVHNDLRTSCIYKGKTVTDTSAQAPTLKNWKSSCPMTMSCVKPTPAPFVSLQCIAFAFRLIKQTSRTSPENLQFRSRTWHFQLSSACRMTVRVGFLTLTLKKSPGSIPTTCPNPNEKSRFHTLDLNCKFTHDPLLACPASVLYHFWQQQQQNSKCCTKKNWPVGRRADDPTPTRQLCKTTETRD